MNYYKGDIIVEKEEKIEKDYNYGRALYYYVNRSKLELENYKLVKRPIINHIKSLLNQIK